MLDNPVLVSVALMTLLCLLRFNVLLSILVSGLAAGVLSGKSLIESIKLIITGMQGNLETALSYILLGAIATAIAKSNLTAILLHKTAALLGHRKFWVIFGIAIISCFSQNLIPVHIAFIPILIPPLLVLFNKLKIDRRAISCALAFGLGAPYIAFSVGFGLLFHNIIKRELANSNLEVSISDIGSVMWIGGLAMVAGLLASVIYYSRDREYKDTSVEKQEFLKMQEDLKMTSKEWGVLAGAVVAFGVQIVSDSLPLGGIAGLIVMVAFKGIEYKRLDKIMDGGIGIMGFIAFIMLVAAGYGNVLRESGGIAELVEFASAISGNQFGGALIMLLIGLLVTMGIGTSFGTIPIIASIYVPLSLSLGFSPAAIILLVGVAAALGDTGSPASDSTLGPTSGLNADGQHNHIYDTCVPTFIFFNIPLIIFGVAGALLLS